MKDTKKELRNIVLSSLKSFNIDKRKADSKLLQQNLQNFLLKENLIHKKIGLFSPLVDEIDSVFDKEKTFAFPKMDEGTINFYESSSNDLELIKAYGREFKEPKVLERCSDLEVLIVPGLAFSPGGKRLGRGKGYYDKYFSTEQRDIIKIGVCFDEQVFDEEKIQMDEFDVFMDFVITPSKCYRS